METADQSSKDLKGVEPTAPTIENVNFVKEKGREKPKRCYRCGRRHDPNTCKFKDASCHKCGKPGHISPACKTTSQPPVYTSSKRYNPRSYRGKKAGSTKWMDAELEDNGDSLPMCTLREGDPLRPPIQVHMKWESWLS